MKLKDKLIDAIECLKSCIEDDAKSSKELNELQEYYAVKFLNGRIDGYRKAIEVLNYILVTSWRVNS